VTLPTGFVGFLLQAFKGASKDKASSILQGVHVSSKGMAATDGKQLTHIPLPLSMKGEVILPPSPMYSALRKWRWCSLSHWDEWFAITGIGFELIMKGMAGTYPRYESICPADKSLDIAADIQETAVVRAVEFLKSIPKDNHGFTELMVYPDRLELSDQQGHECTLAATSASTSLPCGIFCDAAYLLQMLSLGHRRVCFSSQTVTPIVTTGGSGKYLFMPLKGRPQPRTPAAAVSAVHPQPQQAIQPKEKQTMQKSPVTLPAAATSAPSPSSAIVPPRTAIPEQNEPLAELAANLNAMREHLDDLNARLAEAGRKIREALVLQRQKERTYQEANRKLERIRMAV
jgi:hypothetical protein